MTMKHVYNGWINSVRRSIGALIVYLLMSFSTLSIACSTDSLPDRGRPIQAERIDLKPIRLSESGARQVLRDRVDLVTLRGIVASQDTLLVDQQRAIADRDKLIGLMNRDRQQTANAGQQARTQAETYRRRWHAARSENWLWRGGAALYVGYQVWQLIGPLIKP
jgi:hypothetical protein